jgi:general secretion pathway protein K
VKDRKGVALVLVLLMVALLAAMVVEFVHGVQVHAQALKNLHTYRRLRVLSATLLKGSSPLLKKIFAQSYTYPGTYELARELQDVLLTVRLRDENSLFNVNTLVHPNGTLNEQQYEGFRLLLEALALEPSLADTVVDWIDPDQVPMPEGNEEGAKNAPLSSVEELGLFLPQEAYDTLRSYLTIYGDGLVNINGASVPVLMSLGLDEELAQRVLQYRELDPFGSVGELSEVAGLREQALALTDRITVRTSALGITVAAQAEGIRVLTECVLEPQGQVLYWRQL